MDAGFPHQEDEDFIPEQIRSPEEVKYPLPPEIIKILDRVREAILKN